MARSLGRRSVTRRAASRPDLSETTGRAVKKQTLPTRAHLPPLEKGQVVRGDTTKVVSRMRAGSHVYNEPALVLPRSQSVVNYQVNPRAPKQKARTLFRNGVPRSEHRVASSRFRSFKRIQACCDAGPAHATGPRLFCFLPLCASCNRRCR